MFRRIKRTLSVNALRHKRIKPVENTTLIDDFIKRECKLLPVKLHDLLLLLLLGFNDKHEICYHENHKKSENNLQKKPLQLIGAGPRRWT
jgi:hypothetical protein